ncbi:serine/threonine protein kinase [Polyangium jinanense]|uniref:non-specific serine/threonine protein kinase n=1 Tax=Polyangium jinanense TaxID=2829994 RepID=A0A9X3WZ71_9BACT|nr:serine/threonine protein kinase [Polyangium jinanense]MDC3954721.1 protein kinase [Polyangium jinanense]MDC3981024.1 protein kinase [Polyangium jinanense]
MSDAPENLREGRYAVVRLLGEGGQGATFEAVDKKEGQPVAIKRFRVRGAKSWKEVELAEREARVLANLSHPGLPRYVEHFEEGGELFLVTQKIEGESLAAMQKRGATLGEADVIRLLRDASAILDYLHGRAPPVVHRDIKPSNVLRRPDGSFALIDFGAVRDKMKPEGGSTVVGTFGFMAPEQFQGRAMPASDVYAIGATAVSMLTGMQPEDLPHKGLAIDVEAALGRSARPALVAALVAMLEPDPDKRAHRLAPLLEKLGEAPSKKADKHAAKGEEKAERKAEKRERKAERRAERWEQRRERWEQRQERWAREYEKNAGSELIPGPIAGFLLFGLTVAQLAVLLGVRVIAPFVLNMLSLLFGKALREAAVAVNEAGKMAHGSLERAKGIIRRRAQDLKNEGPRIEVQEVNDPSGEKRVRVDVKDQADVSEDERLAEEEAAEAEREGRKTRRR